MQTTTRKHAVSFPWNDIKGNEKRFLDCDKVMFEQKQLEGFFLNI